MPRPQYARPSQYPRKRRSPSHQATKLPATSPPTVTVCTKQVSSPSTRSFQWDMKASRDRGVNLDRRAASGSCS